MATGIPEIDEQHRRLVVELNDLIEAMRAGVGKEQLSKTLDFLGEYVQNHFAQEEDCFEKYQCPFALQNKAAHEDFLETFLQFKEDFDREGPTLPLIIRVETEIAGWYTTHVKGVDCKLKERRKETA